jgi:hypothetical protein
MTDDIYICSDDLKKIYRKEKRKIAWVFICGSVLLGFYFLLKPPLYEAVATFKQSSIRHESGDLKNLLRSFSGSSSEISIVPLMLSRTVLTNTMEELGLQAVVNERGTFGQRALNLQSNLSTEAKLKPSEQQAFTFKNVKYEGEAARHFFLRFLSPDSYELLDNRKEKLLTAALNESVSYQNLSFTLAQTASRLQIGKLYPLTIVPKAAVLGQVKNRITIKPLREDKNILCIHFQDVDPVRAAAFINTMISKYEEFLVAENKTIIGAQLKYLDQRKGELHATLDSDIQEHVSLLKKSLLDQGFMGVEEEINILLEPIQNYKARLNEIEIELAGLQKRAAEIGSTPSRPSLLIQQFGSSLAGQIEEAKASLLKLTNDELPHQSAATETLASLLKDFEQAKELWKTGQDEAHKHLYEEKKQLLTSHLQSLVQHLASRQKNFQESSDFLAHSEVDFHGMTLTSAQELFQQYSLELDNLHAQLKQVVFFRDHLHEPHFEISTLSNVLNDTVTQQLVHKASELEGFLCDSINRSSREHQRLKESLSIQKKFLETHLTQTLELGKIRIQLLQEKLGSLFIVMEELLLKEKTVLEDKLAELKQSMQGLPEIWHLDKRLKFKAELTKGMMEGLTHIAETKNLSRYLFQIESKILDSALPPESPQPPYLLLKALSGGLILASLFYFLSLVKAFSKGLPASLTTLRLIGGHAAGKFSRRLTVQFDELSDQDLETLRSMAQFLLERKEKSAAAALLSRRGSPYCFNLAQLLSLHQQKILIIDCNFDRIVAPEDQPGLLQYLNQAVTDLPVRYEKGYHFIPSGGIARHGVELLSSERFSRLLAQCKEQYDFIFLLRQASLSSHDATQMLQIADLAVILTDEEPQACLKPYLEWSRHKEKLCATFAEYPVVTE